METAIKVIFGILVVLFLATQTVSCTECWNAGGTPVRGVIGYACIK